MFNKYESHLQKIIRNRIRSKSSFLTVVSRRNSLKSFNSLHTFSYQIFEWWVLEKILIPWCLSRLWFIFRCSRHKTELYVLFSRAESLHKILGWNDTLITIHVVSLLLFGVCTDPKRWKHNGRHSDLFILIKYVWIEETNIINKLG